MGRCLIGFFSNGSSRTNPCCIVLSAIINSVRIKKIIGKHRMNKRKSTNFRDFAYFVFVCAGALVYRLTCANLRTLSIHVRCFDPKEGFDVLFCLGDVRALFANLIMNEEQNKIAIKR